MEREDNFFHAVVGTLAVIGALTVSVSLGLGVCWVFGLL